MSYTPCVFPECVDKRSADLIHSLKNQRFEECVLDALKLFKPKNVYIQSSDPADKEYIRKMAIESGEEKVLDIEGHTYHFDDPRDAARATQQTKVLLSAYDLEHRLEKGFPDSINCGERESCLKEVRGFMQNAMGDRTLLISVYCLGTKSPQFGKIALQFTDSWYVAHSENLLYRNGWDILSGKLVPEKGNFDSQRANFYVFYHTRGPIVPETGLPVDYENRRIYIDPTSKSCYSYSAVYAGNSLFKKLSLRLAIHEANQGKKWLTEHMFLSGVRANENDKPIYIAGAYPSACGKTSTAMAYSKNVFTSEIIGDDMIYLKNIDGIPRAVNIEGGVFGIIDGVNSIDDDLIFECLETPREVVFSNVLIGDDHKPYWSGMYASGQEKKYPEHGVNIKGEWKKDPADPKQMTSHPNARYTLQLSELKNVSEKVNDPNGVPLSAILYGGRDSSTCPCLYEALNWEHGVVIGSMVESETTAATIGQTGVVKSSPMANLDFLIVPMPVYIQNHFDFGNELGEKAPHVFGTNYFLKDEKGQFLNEKTDKRVWLRLIAKRVTGEIKFVETPIGSVPKFEDVHNVFEQIYGAGRNYTREEYNTQFAIRARNYLDKIERISKLYENIVPKKWVEIRDTIKLKLEAAIAKTGKDVILPEEF